MTDSEYEEQPQNMLSILSNSEYVEIVFSKFLDTLSHIHPAINTPYLSTEDKGDGVVEVSILIHLRQP